eukprot:TRINITY_DN15943_c0_g1_i2.p2 TRINITY_DN15943_c0_g1~~TRINITY_DN15943_c0_g1_i2.p2  ORF type:complete len:430 (+),score=111.27 TRINITY_DN15943_c0_g1_i2:76-1290(+)
MPPPLSAPPAGPPALCGGGSPPRAERPDAPPPRQNTKPTVHDSDLAIAPPLRPAFLALRAAPPSPPHQNIRIAPPRPPPRPPALLAGDRAPPPEGETGEDTEPLSPGAAQAALAAVAALVDPSLAPSVLRLASENQRLQVAARARLETAASVRTKLAAEQRRAAQLQDRVEAQLGPSVESHKRRQHELKRVLAERRQLLLPAANELVRMRARGLPEPRAQPDSPGAAERPAGERQQQLRGELRELAARRLSAAQSSAGLSELADALGEQHTRTLCDVFAAPPSAPSPSAAAAPAAELRAMRVQLDGLVSALRGAFEERARLRQQQVAAAALAAADSQAEACARALTAVVSGQGREEAGRHAAERAQWEAERGEMLSALAGRHAALKRVAPGVTPASVASLEDLL